MTKDEIETAIGYAERIVAAPGGLPVGMLPISRALLHLHALTAAPLPEELREIEAQIGDAEGRDCNKCGGGMELRGREFTCGACGRSYDDDHADARRLLAGIRAQAAEIVALREALEAAASTMVAESMAGLTVLGGEP